MHFRYRDRLVLLLLSDLATLLAAFFLAMVAGYKTTLSAQAFCQYDWGVVTMFVSVFVLFFILDVYSLHRMPEGVLAQSLVVGTGLFLSAVVVTFIFFFFRNTVPRAVFILFYCFSWVFLAFVRYVYSRFVRQLIFWNVLLVGDLKQCEETALQISARPYLRSRVKGCLTNDLGSTGNPCAFLGTIDRLVATAEKEKIDQVIVTASKIDDDLMKQLLACMRKKIKVSDFRHVMEDITGRVPVENLGDNWFIQELTVSDKRYFWYAKRTVDILASLASLCLAAPLLPFVALMIRLDSRGPVFYTQMRRGRGGRLFRVWKLRTMQDGADRNNVLWTEKNDGRITRVGRLLRKIRLDEVPQMYNVLRGDMSLIGPRPEAASLADRYQKEIPYYNERHMVTPGLTGWAQINYNYGNSIEDTRSKLMFDFYYIKNRSVALDMIIFLRTIRTVLTGKGAL